VAKFQGFRTENFETCETLKRLLGVQFIPRRQVRGGNGNPEGQGSAGFETGNLKLETDIRPDAD
jgi:hypothetical protein